MKWMNVHIGGQEWTIYKVGRRSKFLRDGGQVLHGKCYFNECKIYIRKDDSEQEIQDTLIHELLHALIYVSGASLSINRVANRELSADDGEEQIVTEITPLLHRLLKDIGFTFPA